MSKWKLITPYYAKNLVTNPSFEAGTSGWTASTAGLTRSSSYSTFGAFSLYYPNATTTQYTYYDITLAASTTYYVKFWYLINSSTVGLIFKVQDLTTPAYILTDTIAAGTALTWYEHSTSFTTSAGVTSYRLEFYANSGLATHIYLDGVMVTEESGDFLYIDGDQKGCRWIGQEHASPSERLVTSRSGGIVTDFRDDYNIRISGRNGTGLTTMDYLPQDKPFVPGARTTGLKVPSRTFQLSGHIASCSLQADRNKFIDAISPLAVKRSGDVPQPITLRYEGDEKTLHIEAYYDGGMEDTYDVEQYNTESVALRFLANDNPYWYQYPQSGAELSDYATQTYYAIAGQINGEWSSLSVGAITGTGAIYAITKGPDGNFYVGGDFTTIDGVANTAYIAQYNPVSDTWSPLSTGLNGVVRALVFTPDGTLYIGGDFTNAGGTGANYVATWDGTNYATLQAAQLNNIVITLSFDPTSGDIYIGGQFTQDSTPTTYNYICRYDGTNFNALGSTGVDNIVRAVAVRSDGLVLAGGDFANAAGSAAPYLAAWTGSAWYAVRNSTGPNNTVHEILVTPQDVVYVGGDFTTFDGDTVNRIMKLTTITSGFVNYTLLAGGINDGGVYGLSYDTEGVLHVCGSFTAVDGLNGYWRAARWLGDSFAPEDITFLSTTLPYVALSDGVDTYYGFSGSAVLLSSANTTVTLPNGASETYPVIKIQNDAAADITLVAIKNFTTGQRIDFNNMTIFHEEIITIDLMEKTVTSSFGRPLPDNPIPGGDLQDFYLQAGGNEIFVFVHRTGLAPVATAWMQYNTQYWSLDAAEDA